MNADAQHYAESSAWAAQEKKAFTGLFAGAHFDWLVAPVQVQQRAFDRSERSLMAAELTRALIARGQSVPNSYLVERAVGEAQRRTSMVEIDTLARLVGAKTVLMPYVGHDGNQHLTITLVVYRKPEPGTDLFMVRPVYLSAGGLPFSNAVAPIDVFANALPALMVQLGVPSETAPRPATVATTPTIPDSPEKLITADDNGALEDSARLAILAEIAPQWTRSSERLFERSLMASRLATESPQQRFLKAYALFRLNLRPAALPLLRRAHPNAALKALAALVNGNIKGTSALVSKTSGPERLILELELHDLARAYHHDDGIELSPWLAALANRSDAWRRLLEQRWQYGVAVSGQSNLPLRQLLDTLYPLSGQSLEDLLAGQAAAPGLSRPALDLELAVHTHIRALMAQHPTAWCCDSATERPNNWDLLTVIEAWADANLMEAIDYQLSVQGLPENARKMLTELDPYYEGRPDFEVLHEQVDLALAAKAPEAEQPALRRTAREHALRSLMASGGQTNDAVNALAALGPDPTGMGIAAAYAADYPFNPYWLGNPFVIDPKDRISLEREALARSQTGVAYLGMLYLEGGPGLKPEAEAALRGRFLGHPDRDAVQAILAPAVQSVAAYTAQLKKKLKTEPDNWDNRNSLASSLLMQGDAVEAAKVLVAYPPFQQPDPSEPIRLSNIAAEAGHAFYWRGAEAQARQLYRIATRYQVGSEAEMTAAIHLRLLDGDLPSALKEAEARAERYPNGVSYSIYLCLLHLLGRSDEAWKAFNFLLDQPLGPGPWESAVVGLRMAGTTQAQLDAWLAQPHISGARTQAGSWAALLQLIWGTTDGRAPPDLAARVGRLAGEPRGALEDTGRMASYPSAQPDQQFIVVRSDFRAAQRPALAPGTPVESDEPLFARALVAMQQGDYLTAVMRFDDLAARYPIERPTDGGDAIYALPDFAYASARTGDPLKLEAFLDGLPGEIRFFELSLARAYFQGLVHHDNAASLASLEQAFRMIEHYFGRTPSAEYQYADTAERLYKDTKDPRFRDKAVSWAHLMQRLQPWSAWAYTIEAELTGDPEVRSHALVRALFLDPLSPRLTAIPSADLDFARGQLEKDGNPFLRPPQLAPVATSRPSQRLSVYSAPQ